MQPSPEPLRAAFRMFRTQNTYRIQSATASRNATCYSAISSLRGSGPSWAPVQSFSLGTDLTPGRETCSSKGRCCLVPKSSVKNGLYAVALLFGLRVSAGRHLQLGLPHSMPEPDC